MLKWLEEHSLAGTVDTQAYAQSQLLEKDPQWGPNDNQGFQVLEHYREVLLGSMTEGGKKALNMSKTSEVF